MICRRVGLILFALCVGAWPVAAATGRMSVDPFVVGPWRGQVVFKDAQFTHCAMRTFQGGWGIYVVMDGKKAVRLGLHNDVINFTKGKAARVSIQFDERPPSAILFKALQKKTLGTALNREMAAQLSAAGRLRLKVGDIHADLALSRTGDAFRQLAACAEKGKRIRSGVAPGAAEWRRIAAAVLHDAKHGSHALDLDHRLSVGGSVAILDGRGEKEIGFVPTLGPDES